MEEALRQHSLAPHVVIALRSIYSIQLSLLSRIHERNLSLSLLTHSSRTPHRAPYANLDIYSYDRSLVIVYRIVAIFLFVCSRSSNASSIHSFVRSQLVSMPPIHSFHYSAYSCARLTKKRHASLYFERNGLHTLDTNTSTLPAPPQPTPSQDSLTKQTNNTTQQQESTWPWALLVASKPWVRADEAW